MKIDFWGNQAGKIKNECKRGSLGAMGIAGKTRRIYWNCEQKEGKMTGW